MATQRQERPDLHRVMSQFRMDTMNQIMSGFNVQHIPLSDGERMSKSRLTGAGIRSLNLREFGENAENSGFIMTIDETMHFAEMGVMRGKMDDVTYKLIPWSYIAREYFHKTPGWLQQRINGQPVRGKVYTLSAEQKATLSLALNDICNKIGSYRLALA